MRHDLFYFLAKVVKIVGYLEQFHIISYIKSLIHHVLKLNSTSCHNNSLFFTIIASQFQTDQNEKFPGFTYTETQYQKV